MTDTAGRYVWNVGDIEIERSAVRREEGILYIPVVEHLPGKHDQKSHAGKTGTAEKALQVAEEGIRYSSIEVAVVVDKQGRELLRKSGNRESVAFTDSDIAAMAGGILTHNHPSGLLFPSNDPRSAGNSFSPTDLQLAAYANLSELRVVTQKHRYTLRPPAGGWGKGWYLRNRASIEDVERGVKERAWAAINRNDLHPYLAEAHHWHEVWKQVAPRLGLTYMREVL